MDCEKFDRVVLDLLYDELDELTAAAARRHMDHCARCGPIGAALRATREVGVLPRAEPSTDLTARILEAERNARAELPLGQRLGRGVSVLAGYAMRPQLAMAAVAILMIGISVFFVRTRPGDREAVRVTERGVPEIEHEPVGTAADRRGSEASAAPASAPLALGRRDAPVAGEPAPAASATTEDREYEAAQSAFEAGRFAEARRAFELLAATGGPRAASAALMAARCARHTHGCAVAAALLDDLVARHPGTSVGNEAIWHAAECRRSLGQTELARRDYLRLSAAPAYAERVEVALATLEDAQDGATPGRAAKARPAAAAPPPRPAPVAGGATSAATTSR